MITASLDNEIAKIGAFKDCVFDRRHPKIPQLIIVDAPLGHVWASTGAHTISSSPLDIGTKAAAKELVELMGMGVMPCCQDDCDQCNQ